jgi:TetR/AcrR family transcriptional regulator, tetracycline repressor protein
MAQLRREDVLAGAFNLLDAEGLDALTMRKLAASLHVQAGALYWHFGGKLALLEAMTERLLADVAVPATVDGRPWDEQVAELCMQLRRALLAHRDGAQLILGVDCAFGGANTARIQRTSTELITSAGFHREQASLLAYALRHYVVGQTMQEQIHAGSAARGELGGSRGASACGGEDEAYRLARPYGPVSDPDKEFAYALGVFLDGIRSRLT